MPGHNMNSSTTTSGGYGSSGMRTWLESAEFQQDVTEAIQEHEVRYRSRYDVSSSLTLYTRFSIMSASNVYWSGYISNSDYDTYFYNDEGEPYTYFKNNNILQAREHFDTTSIPLSTWLLSPYSSTDFMIINFNGRAKNYGASNTALPATRFCLGNSIDESGKLEASVTFSTNSLSLQCGGRSDTVTIDGTGSNDLIAVIETPDLIEKATLDGTKLTIESIYEVGQQGTGKIQVIRRSDDTYKTAEGMLIINVFTKGMQPTT